MWRQGLINQRSQRTDTVVAVVQPSPVTDPLPNKQQGEFIVSAIINIDFYANTFYIDHRRVFVSLECCCGILAEGHCSPRGQVPIFFLLRPSRGFSIERCLLSQRPTSSKISGIFARLSGSFFRGQGALQRNSVQLGEGETTTTAPTKWPVDSEGR